MEYTFENIRDMIKIGYVLDTSIFVGENRGREPYIKPIKKNNILGLLARIEKLNSQMNNEQHFSDLFSEGMNIIEALNKEEENRAMIRKPGWNPMSANFLDFNFRKLNLRYHPIDETTKEDKLQIYLMNNNELKVGSVELRRGMLRSSEMVPIDVVFDYDNQRKKIVYEYDVK